MTDDNNSPKRAFSQRLARINAEKSARPVRQTPKPRRQRKSVPLGAQATLQLSALLIVSGVFVFGVHVIFGSDWQEDISYTVKNDVSLTDLVLANNPAIADHGGNTTGAALRQALRVEAEEYGDTGKDVVFLTSDPETIERLKKRGYSHREPTQ